MLKCLLLALVASVLPAAVIRGVVVDNQSGRPMARALVTVQPADRSAGPSLAANTDLNGSFEFARVPAGAYLLSATHTGYVVAQYGQKEWKSAGAPIVLDESSPAELKIRLKRFGAIGGTVVDENEVGLPEHEVLAYRSTRPPRVAARAVTDDRGVYRLFGLEPGTYLVRTAAKQHEAGGYLPTFSTEAAVADQAHSVDVALDETVDHVNVKPFPGRLLRLAGRVDAGPRRPVTLTLASDVGREIITALDNFEFKPLAPGQYELFATTGDDSRYGVMAEYMRLSMDLDRNDFRVALSSFSGTPVVFEHKGQTVDPSAFQILARRKDLAGEEPPQTVRLTNGRAMLAPGRWDVSVAPAVEWCVIGFSGPRADGGGPGRADGWNEILVGRTAEPVRFILSSTPGSVHGTVTAGQDPASGAPVFLEAYDAESGRRVMDPRMARTDAKGRFQFAGLAPGTYRLLATFEYEMPDAAAMAARGRAFPVAEGREMQQDVELYVIR